MNIEYYTQKYGMIEYRVYTSDLEEALASILANMFFKGNKKKCGEFLNYLDEDTIQAMAKDFYDEIKDYFAEEFYETLKE